MSIAALLLTITLTAYSPACGKINGSLQNYYADGSSRPLPAHHLRYAACGQQYAFGTIIRIEGMADLGVTEVVCHDRGSAVTGVDVLVLTGQGCEVDRRIARQIGRRARNAYVVMPDPRRIGRL